MASEETVARQHLASAIHEWLEKSGTARVVAVDNREPFPVLYIEAKDGTRHHLRIINVRGWENRHFEETG